MKHLKTILALSYIHLRPSCSHLRLILWLSYNQFMTVFWGRILVMCNPSMNELWATWTGLCIDLYGSRLLTADSKKGCMWLKIRPLMIKWSSYNKLMTILWSSYDLIVIILWYFLSNLQLSLGLLMIILQSSHGELMIILESFYDHLMMILQSYYNHLWQSHHYVTSISSISYGQHMMILQYVMASIWWSYSVL